MRNAFAIVLAVFVPMIVWPVNAQTSKKEGAKSASSKASAPASDPLLSFKRIAKKFEAFFAAGPRKLIEKQKFTSSPNGYVIAIREFAGTDVAYDVRRTDSLVSPYTATISVKLVARSNGSCGNVETSTGAYGWTTAEGALSAMNRAECYKYEPRLSHGGPTAYATDLIFAFQDGRWVFKDAPLVTEAGSWGLWLSIFGNASNEHMTRFAEPEAESMNSVWRDLVK